MKLLGLFFLVLFLCSEAPASSGEIEELQNRIRKQSEELRVLEEELNSYRQNLQELSERESALLERRRSIDAEILRHQSRLDTLASERRMLERDIAGIEEKLRAEREAESEAAQLLNEAANLYYRRKILIGSMPWYSEYILTEPPHRASGALLTLTAEEYEEIKEEVRRISRLREEEKRRMTSLTALEREVAVIQNDLIQRKTRELALLERIRAEREDNQRRLREIEEEKNRLSTLLENLRRRAVDIERLAFLAEDFLKAKGSLPLPSKGRVISRFGRQRHPELDAYIFNRGIIIGAEAGSLVRASAGGEVVYSAHFSGMNNMVVIDHGKDYYTLYGRLESLKVRSGDRVEPFAALGALAAEGLYFELGKGETPLNPLEWLADNSGE